MSKAILIMDMPGSCEGCLLMYGDGSGRYCNVHAGDCIDTADTMGGKPGWCPLREVPRPKRVSDDPYSTFKNDHYNSGWNSCLDAITGGER